MIRRYWLLLVVTVLLIAAVATPLALPALIRHVIIARIQSITSRQVSIDAVDVSALRGHLAIRGFRLAERGGHEPFADFERLDLRLHLPSLLRGHLRISEVILRNSNVHVVRFPTNEFNISDLVQSSGETSRPFDVTVDRFALTGGTVTLEDRALPQWRTWTSEHIEIEARNLSTRRDDGHAVGTSVTGGAPVSVEVQRLRLYPIHLQATVTIEGLDLALTRLYLPPNAPVVLDRGRASTSVTVALDARDGLRIDATGRFEDVALARPGGGDPLAVTPKMTVQLTDLAVQDGGLRLGQLEVDGSALVVDPSGRSDGRLQRASVRASVDGLTWPIRTPARLELLTSVPGRGKLAVSGALQPPPAPSELRLRLVDFDLAPWAGFLAPARLTGVAEADLRVNEPLVVGVPARVRGSIAVKGLGVADARHELLGAQRVEATGLQAEWPARFSIKRLLVSNPRGTIERDRAGDFPLKGLWGRPAHPPDSKPPADVGAVPAPTAPSLVLGIGEIVVRDGAVDWRDDAVTPPVRLDLSRIQATVTGASWPLRGPTSVRVALRPPGGGQFQLAGRVGIDPFTADLRLTTRAAELGPYQAYVPTVARISGQTDLDLTVLLPGVAATPTTVRGRVGVARLDVRDGQRTVMMVDQATATNVDIEWPGRVAVNSLALRGPWILVERDEAGVLPLRALLTTRGETGTASASIDGDGWPVTIALGRLIVDDGAARFVDRSVSPAFAEDLRQLAVRIDGLSTAPARPARVQLSGRLGPAAVIELRGTVAPLGGPLGVDVSGELRQFAVPRANSYMLGSVAWKASQGWLTTNVQGRIRGDALEARTVIRLSQLQVVRAGGEDEAQARVGLPLGLIVALMKDARGEIHVTLPVGGRLHDPRFDFSEAIWAAVRTVAVKAIALPVSWIGRIQISPDSRIQAIEVEPAGFQPGTPTLTHEGQAQLARVAAFLRELPDVRMAVTPVVTTGDLAELRQEVVRARIDRLGREPGGSSQDAAVRLFRERFPGREPPETIEKIVDALALVESPTEAESGTLASRRVEAVLAGLKQAGIDGARLERTRAVEPPEPAEGGRVEFRLTEPDKPRRPQVLALLRRLGGTIAGPDRGDE
jgi:Domain of Unknown Function (DUF748)